MSNVDKRIEEIEAIELVIKSPLNPVEKIAISKVFAGFRYILALTKKRGEALQEVQYRFEKLAEVNKKLSPEDQNVLNWVNMALSYDPTEKELE